MVVLTTASTIIPSSSPKPRSTKSFEYSRSITIIVEITVKITTSTTSPGPRFSSRKDCEESIVGENLIIAYSTKCLGFVSAFEISQQRQSKAYILSSWFFFEVGIHLETIRRLWRHDSPTRGYAKINLPWMYYILLDQKRAVIDWHSSMVRLLLRSSTRSKLLLSEEVSVPTIVTLCWFVYQDNMTPHYNWEVLWMMLTTNDWTQRPTAEKMDCSRLTPPLKV